MLREEEEGELWFHLCLIYTGSINMEAASIAGRNVNYGVRGMGTGEVKPHLSFFSFYRN